MSTGRVWRDVSGETYLAKQARNHRNYQTRKLRAAYPHLVEDPDDEPIFGQKDPSGDVDPEPKPPAARW
jgi:hypothetical protein